MRQFFDFARIGSVLFVIAGIGSSADAGMVLSVSTDGTNYTAVANDSATPDQIGYAGTINGVSVQVTAGLTTSSPGDLNVGELDIGYSGTAPARSTAEIWLKVTSDGFTTPPGSTPAWFMNSVFANTSSNANSETFQSSLDGNAGTLVGPYDAGGNNGTGTVDAFGTQSVPYTLGDITTVSFEGLSTKTHFANSGSTIVSNNPDFTPNNPVPEPGSIICWTIAVTFFGVAGFRRRQVAVV